MKLDLTIHVDERAVCAMEALARAIGELVQTHGDPGVSADAEELGPKPSNDRVSEVNSAPKELAPAPRQTPRSAPETPRSNPDTASVAVAYSTAYPWAGERGLASVRDGMDIKQVNAKRRELGLPEFIIQRAPGSAGA